MNSPDYWRGKRCLITGATGFLGGWMVRGLLDLGAQVSAIVRRDNPRCQFAQEKLAEECRLIRGDMTDPDVINEAFVGGVDFVFHVGAISDVLFSGENPALCIENNVLSALRLLEYVRVSSPSTVVVISSSDKAYGPQEVPYRETQLLAPRHSYEVSKAAQDHIARCYGKNYGIPVAVTRCANFFGGWDLNLNRIIPYTITSIARQEPIVLRSDGKFTRDFIYIEDAVACKLLLAETLADSPEIHGEAFNFSYENDVQMIDIVRKICSLMEATPDIQIADGASAEIRYMAVDSTKSKEILKWQPNFDMDSGLLRTIGWYRSNLDLLAK